MYGHMNNVVHYKLFDTAINHWLIEEGLLDPLNGAIVGLVVETGCRYHAEAMFPDRVKARKANKWDFIPPGQDAESYEILSWRIGAWLSSVERQTVCVCHGGVIRSIFRLVSGMDKDEASRTQIPQDKILKVQIDRNSAEWIS